MKPDIEKFMFAVIGAAWPTSMALVIGDFLLFGLGIVWILAIFGWYQVCLRAYERSGLP